jgi:hypothetical protein
MAARRFYVGAFTAMAAVVALSASAWACTAFTSLKTPATGVAESQIDVTGQSLISPGQPIRAVELRWNALNGPVLAQAQADDSGRITASVTVPAASPGVYYVVAVVDGRAVARSAFEVTPPPGVAATAPNPGGLRASDALANPSTGGSTGPQAGVILLAVGLVLLAGGLGSVVIRSGRRAPAGVDDLTR